MRKKIAVLSGGTGGFVILSGLKEHDVKLSAIVNMADSGGSTGVLRDELGVLPPGDVRQCLVALSNSDVLLRNLFNYRFEEGRLKGQNFGNLFISALEKTSGDFVEAVEAASKILAIKGRVIPVTTQEAHLCARLENGKEIRGEHNIDEPKHDGSLKIVKAYYKPKVKATLAALKAIREADIIVLGPGDMYTSIVPNLLVDGIQEALKAAKGKLIFISNLMTRWGQTPGLSLEDHVDIIQKYLGGRKIDAVISNSGKIPKSVLKKYAKHKELPVQYSDLRLARKQLKIINKDLVKRELIKISENDQVTRSLIRHDPVKLARAIMSIKWKP